MRIALVLLALVAACLAGGRAFAHAGLVGADPPAGAVVAEAPDAAVLVFSEPVEPLAFRWFPPQGDPVEAAPVAEGTRVSVALPPEAGPGTFLLSWRVASADGHPVGGSHVFSVGAPTAAVGPAAERPAWAAAGARVLLTTALVFAAGGAVFVTLVDRGAAPPSLACRLARVAAWAVVPAAVIATGLHGLDMLGAPAGALLGSAPWAAALASPFGRTVAAGVLAAMAAVAALRLRGPVGATFAVVAWGLAAASFAFFGHAATASPRWLTAPAVALHGAAFVFWIGALPGLAERAGVGRGDLVPTIRRFSAAAVPLVALLVLSGTVLAVVQVGDPARLMTTAYGRLLVAKLVVVLGLLGLAVLNRLVLTPAVARGEGRDRFRRSVRAEIVLGVAILALAGGFRLTPPPRLAVPEAPRHVHLHGETIMAGLTLDPGRPGRNAVSLAITPDAPRPLEVRVAFAEPAGGVEPIRVAATYDGSAWRAEGIFLPRGGTWQVSVDVLVSDFDRTTLTGEIAVPED